MATTNSIDDPRKNASTTLVWRMQRGDDLAWAEAVRRTVKGCKSAKTQLMLLAAIDAHEAKTSTPAPAAPVVTPTRTTTVAFAEKKLPAGYTLVWVDDIPVLVAA